MQNRDPGRKAKFDVDMFSLYQAGVLQEEIKLDGERFGKIKCLAFLKIFFVHCELYVATCRLHSLRSTT